MKEKIIRVYDEVVREYKKVTFPTIAELKESTKIVLALCGILAVFTYIIDIGITKVFEAIF